QYFEKNLSSKQLNSSIEDTTDTESGMNCVWEKIATGIIHAANKNISRKKQTSEKSKEENWS
ncbi:2490_t:CDS:2, partial [Dentiscutata heterogama]